MKSALLAYLVCPDCQVELACQPAVRHDTEIESGTLCCPRCGTCYPIVRGIPRFVTADHPLSDRGEQTADAFGWQWLKFDNVNDLATYEAQFLDWVHPIEPAFLADKVVLDAGCGMGRFSLVASEFGARAVLAVDASDAVESARKNARGYPNVHVVQGDILNLPFRRGAEAQVHFAFSIGVLHHMDDPQGGFNALVRHLTREGTVFVWVYGRENNGWVIHVVNPIRSLLTSRLPRRALYVLSWLVTVGLHPVLKLMYRPANAAHAKGWLRRVLPYNDYLAWLSRFRFAYTHNVVFDHLVAPVAYYLRRQEFEAWFGKAGFELLDLSWRNRNSWRGHGRHARADQ
jgi:SAM-dependent methyltransferase